MSTHNRNSNWNSSFTGDDAPALPTTFATRREAARLVKGLELTAEELTQVAGGLKAANCCKPDGGTCCPNKKLA